MGTGTYHDATFTFAIVAPHSWTIEEKVQWQAAFLEASRALFQATDGQIHFGEVFMSDEGWGLGHADAVLHAENSTAYATNGKFGYIGEALHLYSNHRSGRVGTIVHEFAHHAFGLGDEYTGPIQVDDVNTAPDTNDPPITFENVPLVASDLDSQSLERAFAFVTFDGVLERSRVAVHTESWVVLEEPFSQDPRTADFERIVYQPQFNYSNPDFPEGIEIGCADPDVEAPVYSIMNHSNQFDAEKPITEFCSQSNHDPDNDTSHDDRHNGLSCWEVIVQHMYERYGAVLNAPDPAVHDAEFHETPGNIANANFIDLIKEARIVLVADRSGSMGSGNKIAGVRIGIEQWLNEATLNEDWLSIVWYNGQIGPVEPLAQPTPNSIAQTIGQLNGVNPVGGTNIRDALFKAVEEIDSRDGRAAVQAIVLLTDGVHTTPIGSSLSEAIPTLQQRGIPVFVIMLGPPETVDHVALEELATETGGLIDASLLQAQQQGFLVTEQNFRAWIANEMARMNSLLRFGEISNGIAAVDPAPPDSAASKALRRFNPDKAVDLKSLALLQGYKDYTKLLRAHKHAQGITVPLYIEKGAERLRMSAAFSPKAPLALYLVDPQGSVLDPAIDSSVTLLGQGRPYRTLMVKNPEPGQWHAVITRVADGPREDVFYCAGVVNRQIVASGECTRNVELGQPIEIHARALWGEKLSGLRITARIVGPMGGESNISLSDNEAPDPASGEYTGTFLPNAQGRYHGYIRIVATEQSIRAGIEHRAVHMPTSEKKLTALDLRVDSPMFVRRVPIYFDVGRRPEPKDIDPPKPRLNRDGDKTGGVRLRKKKLKVRSNRKALMLIEKRRKGES